MKRFSWVILCALALGMTAWGQNGPGHEDQKRSTITVTVMVSSSTPLNCTTSLGMGMFPAFSWTFGATNPVSIGAGGGGQVGKTTFSDLVISKRTDACTPQLFAAVAEGKHLQKVTIVQQDNNKDDVFSVALEDVVIANYQLSGDISREVPSEQLSFNFAKIMITDLITGTKFGWDLKQNKPF